MPVRVLGPDGQTYAFPDGTTKDQAISYFKAKNITGPSSPPSQSGVWNAITGKVKAAQDAYDKVAAPVSDEDRAKALKLNDIIPRPGGQGLGLGDVANVAQHVGRGALQVLQPVVHPWETAKGVAAAAGKGATSGGLEPVYDAAKGVVDTFKQEGPMAAADIAGQVIAGEDVGAGIGAVKNTVAKTPVGQGLSQARQKFVQATYPRSLSLNPQEVAAQDLVKSLGLPLGKSGEKSIADIRSASSELPHVRAHAEKTGLPINSKADAAKASVSAAKELQDHIDTNIVGPHRGKLQATPGNYHGEMTGNGGKATIGQMMDRINDIREDLNGKLRVTGLSDQELRAERSALTSIVHKALGKFNNMDPADIAGAEVRGGKMRTLGKQFQRSADRDSIAAGRQEVGRQGIATVGRMIDETMQRAGGGPEVIGNRTFKDALEKFPVQETPLPSPVPEDASAVEANRAAAQQEFLRAHELEQGSQDAAAARNTEAERLRAQNVQNQRDVAQSEYTRGEESQQSAQELAAQRNAEAERLRAENVAKQKELTDNEFRRSIEVYRPDGEQTPNALTDARNRFADAQRRANVNQQAAQTQAANDAARTAAQGEFVHGQNLDQAAQSASVQRAAAAEQERNLRQASEQAAQDATTAANKQVANQEVLHAMDLQQSAEDAASQRSVDADKARAEHAASLEPKENPLSGASSAEPLNPRRHLAEENIPQGISTAVSKFEEKGFPFNHYGLRIDGSPEFSIGDMHPGSSTAIDDESTGVSTGGSSAIRFNPSDPASITEALRNLHKNGYIGDTISVLGGETGRLGSDPGEVVLGQNGQVQVVHQIPVERTGQGFTPAGQETPSTATPSATPAPAAPQQTMGEKEVVAADPARGVQSVTLPVVEPAAAASPETHVFSKAAYAAANPGADVSEAAAQAAKDGYEVQP